MFFAYYIIGTYTYRDTERMKETLKRADQDHGQQPGTSEGVHLERMTAYTHFFTMNCHE